MQHKPVTKEGFSHAMASWQLSDSSCAAESSFEACGSNGGGGGAYRNGGSWRGPAKPITGPVENLSLIPRIPMWILVRTENCVSLLAGASLRERIPGEVVSSWSLISISHSPSHKKHFVLIVVVGQTNSPATFTDLDVAVIYLAQDLRAHLAKLRKFCANLITNLGSERVNRETASNCVSPDAAMFPHTRAKDFLFERGTITQHLRGQCDSIRSSHFERRDRGLVSRRRWKTRRWLSPFVSA